MSGGICERIAANLSEINKLRHENEELTWTYVHAHASPPLAIHSAVDGIEKYLRSHYASVDAAFIASMRKNFTLCPMTEKLFRITKYNTRMSYDLVLYEWCGERIMYIRADSNNDCYYEGCDSFNGFKLDAAEFDTDGDLRYNTWWKTAALPEYAMVDKIEKCIKRRYDGSDFAERCEGIPDKYKPIVAIFDKSERVHYLICEDILPRAYEFMP